MNAINIQNTLYTANANLSGAKRLLKEIISTLEDSEDKDDLVQAHRHVEDAELRIKRYGHAGRLFA